MLRSSGETLYKGMLSKEMYCFVFYENTLVTICETSTTKGICE